MWSCQENAPVWRSARSDGQILLHTVAPGITLSMFPHHESCRWFASDEAGRGTFRLSVPASGIALFGMMNLPVQISLPLGVTVRLSHERLPESQRIRIEPSDSLPHWTDTGLRLEVRVNGVVVSHGTMQHGLRSTVNFSGSEQALHFRLAAGFFFSESGELRVFANAGNLPLGGSNASDSPLPLEQSPAITGDPFSAPAALQGDPSSPYPLSGPFGRGISLQSPVGATAFPVGEVTVDAVNVGYPGPAQGWFAQQRPAERALPIRPDTTAITARRRASIAWGRHRAFVSCGPIAWGLASLEAEGHSEWLTGGSLARGLQGTQLAHAHVPGLSRLYEGSDGTVFSSDGPAEKSNISAHSAENMRLRVLRASYSSGDGWSTGSMDVTTVLGAWNEYRPESWVPRSVSHEGGTITGAFIAISIQRADATNLGSATSESECVEITRFRLSWFVAIRSTAPSPFTGADVTTYTTREGAVILSPEDAASLFAGNQIVINNPYQQGTYPTPTSVSVSPTLTIQAIG